MSHPLALGVIAQALALSFAISSAHAFDESKYPEIAGKWRRPPGISFNWDPTKGRGLAQQAPLTPEYQAQLEASIADVTAGGSGDNIVITCIPSGMPRIMTMDAPVEFVITPAVTYILFENTLPRHIYTDGRTFSPDTPPSFIGQSIGKWIDEDGDGRYDVLEVETRNFKGPRVYEGTGIPLHKDNQSIIQERIHLNPADKNVLYDEITTIDHALTRPWSVTKKYARIPANTPYYEEDCGEDNRHIVIGREGYLVTTDGYLMPYKKGQPPPDLRYFKQTAK